MKGRCQSGKKEESPKNYSLTMIVLNSLPTFCKGTWSFHCVKVPVTNTELPPYVHLKEVLITEGG